MLPRFRAGVTIQHGSHHTVLSEHDENAYDDGHPLFKALMAQSGPPLDEVDLQSSQPLKIWEVRDFRLAWSSTRVPPAEWVLKNGPGDACAECGEGRFDVLVSRGAVYGCGGVDGEYKRLRDDEAIYDGDTVLIQHHSGETWSHTACSHGALHWRAVKAAGVVPPQPALRPPFDTPEAVVCSLPGGRAAMISKDAQGGLWLSVLTVTKDGRAQWEHSRTNRGIGPPRDCSPSQMVAAHYDGHIILFGGPGTDKKSYALSLEGVIWRTIPHVGFGFDTPVLNCAAAVVGHCLVVAGGSPDGFDRTHTQTIALDLRPGMERWYKLPSLATGVAYHGLALSGKTLYCVLGDLLDGGITWAQQGTFHLDLAGLCSEVENARVAGADEVLSERGWVAAAVSGDMIARNPSRHAGSIERLHGDAWLIPSDGGCDSIGNTPFVRDVWNIAFLPPSPTRPGACSLYTFPPLRGQRPCPRLGPHFVPVGKACFVLFGGVCPDDSRQWPASQIHNGTLHFGYDDVTILEWRNHWEVERLLWLGSRCPDSLLSSLTSDLVHLVLTWLRELSLAAALSPPQ